MTLVVLVNVEDLLLLNRNLDLNLKEQPSQNLAVAYVDERVSGRATPKLLEPPLAMAYLHGSSSSGTARRAPHTGCQRDTVPIISLSSTAGNG
jgi:hypothetical protein